MRPLPILVLSALFALACTEDTSPGDGPAGAAGDAAAPDTAAPSGTAAPTATITTPLDDAVVNVGEAITFIAEIADPDRAPSELEFWWRSDRDGLLSTAKAKSGTLIFETSSLSPGEHEIKVEVTDPTGRTAEARVDIRVNRPPEGPSQVVIEPADPDTGDALTATITKKATDPDGEGLKYLYVWFVGGADAGIAAATVPAIKTKKGESWRVVVRPSDGDATGDPAEAEVTIGNAIPKVQAAEVLPSAGGTDTEFACAPKGWDDPDDDPQEAQIQWLVNGDEVPGATDASIGGEHTAKGDTLVCVLTPSDGTDTGAAVQSDPIPILDTPPTIDVVLVDPAAGDKSTTFQCQPTGITDPDEGDEAKVKIVWVVNGDELPGTTSETFSAQTLKKGDELRCKAVPYSGEVDGSPVLSAPVVVGNAPPGLSSVILQPVPATETSLLTCVPAQPFDPDGDNVAFTYAWYVDDGLVEGEFGDTLSGDHFDKGQKVRCEVIPFDGTDAGQPVASKFEVTIQNSPPTIESVEVTPAEGSKLTEFVCNAKGFDDPDPGDEAGYLYEWRLNGEVVAGGIFETLVPKGLPPGALVCVVTPTDGTDQGPSVESPPAGLLNYAPSITHVELTPDPATEASVLQCTPKGWSDGDDDPEAYEFSWIVNGAEVSGQTTSTLTGAHFEKGQVVLCTATPFDGVATGDGLSSQPVQIKNSPPTLTGATLDPKVGGKKTPFTCSPQGFADADAGDPELYGYAWMLSGVVVPGALDPTFVPGDAASGGATLRCSVKPFDGTDYGDAVESGPATVTNVPPSVASVVVEPQSPKTGQDLQCKASGATDPDSDPVTLAYAWFKNDSLVSGETGAVLPAAKHQRGDQLFCQVTPSDSELSGTPKVSGKVTILNSAPGPVEIAIVPAAPTSSAAFECVVSKPSIDPDAGDTVEIAFEWLTDDAPADWTEAVVPEGTAGPCETWTCRATPTDGTADGPTAEAQAVVDEGSAITLPGGGWVEIPSSESLALTSGKLNAEAWVRVDAYQNAIIISKRNTGPLPTDRGFSLGLRVDGKVTLAVDLDTAAPKLLVSTGKLPLGTWSHVAGSYDGKTARLYVDGAWMGSLPVTGPIDTSAPLRIGRNGPGDEDAYTFMGAVDEVRLMDVALYTAAFTPQLALAAPTGTVGLYHLNEAGGTQAKDASGKGNHGTLKSGVTWAAGLCGAPGDNGAPTTPTVAIQPADPAPGEALTCGAESTDPDDDPLSYAYTWLLEGVAQPAFDQKTLPADVTQACGFWTCQATASDGQAVSAAGSGDVQVGAGGGSSGEITWYGHHGYEPGVSGFPSSVSQFFSTEKVATRIVLPGDALPFILTHVRVFGGAGQSYTTRVYLEAAGAPGAFQTSATFTGTSQLQEVELNNAVEVKGTALWVELQGLTDFWPAFSDGDGQSTKNWIHYCESLFGVCFSEYKWAPLSSLPAPFNAMGDLILDVGTEDWGEPETCD